MFDRTVFGRKDAGPTSLRRAVARLLGWVIAPLALGAAILVLAIWADEHEKGLQQLQGWSNRIVHAVDLHVGHGRSQLEAIAALPEVDRGDLAALYGHARDVVVDHPGTLVALIDTDGKLLINTSAPLGPLWPDRWTVEEQKAHTVADGLPLSVSLRSLASEVFRTGQADYSGLYVGSNDRSPRIATLVPVHRNGKVLYTLLLSYVTDDLYRLLGDAGLPAQARALLLDRDGTVIASNDISPYKLGQRLQLSQPDPQQLVEPDGTAMASGYGKTGAGYTVLVSMPSAIAFRTAYNVLIGWSLVTVAALILSVLGAANFNRRLSEPLRRLAQSVLAGRPPAPTEKSNIQEVDLLAAALRAAAQNDALRRQEHIRHIAAEKREEAIEASEAQMRRVFAGLHVSVTVLDLEGRVIEMNHAPAERVDVARSDVLGRPFWDCCCWAYDPAVQQTIRESVLQACEGREAIRYNVAAHLEEGRLVMVDLQLSPLKDEDGTVTRVVACAVDVQDRVAAIRSLQAREEQARETARKLDEQRWLLDAALQATPAGMLVCDGEGHLLRMNQANRLLWGGAPSSETVHEPTWKGRWSRGQDREGEPLEPHEWPLSDALQNARAQSAVIDIEPFDGSARKTVQISAAPVLDEKGAVVGGVSVHMDITDRVRAQAALQEADRHKNEFLATLGHELRNPLAPIRSAVHLLRRYPTTEPRAIRAQIVIERQANHMTRLVDDLLDLARITQGTIRMEPATVLLQEVATAAVEAVSPLLEAKGVKFEQDLGSEPLYVEGDATRLSQALTNLLTNAGKFTQAAGEVSLRLRGEDGAAIIEVADNGIGLPPDAVERIFGLFVQEQPSGIEGNAGLGIGLTLARNLLRLHGGRLEAASAGPGKGSTFTARLPLARAPLPMPVPAAPPPIQTREEPSRTPYRLVVVDDNRDGCDLMRELLEIGGFDARSAYDGTTALAAVRNTRPDAIVLDIGLPDINGYELCRQIRREIGGGPVVIALTGWGQDQDRRAAQQAGFDSHIIKPADPDVLNETLKKLLRAREMPLPSHDLPPGMPIRGAGAEC